MPTDVAFSGARCRSTRCGAVLLPARAAGDERADGDAVERRRDDLADAEGEHGVPGGHRRVVLHRRDPALHRRLHGDEAVAHEHRALAQLGQSGVFLHDKLGRERVRRGALHEHDALLRRRQG